MGEHYFFLNVLESLELKIPSFYKGPTSNHYQHVAKQTQEWFWSLQRPSDNYLALVCCCSTLPGYLSPEWLVHLVAAHVQKPACRWQCRAMGMVSGASLHSIMAICFVFNCSSLFSIWVTWEQLGEYWTVRYMLTDCPITFEYIYTCWLAKDDEL